MREGSERVRKEGKEEELQTQHLCINNLITESFKITNELC